MIIATSLSTYLTESGDDLVGAFSLAKQDGFEAMGIVVSENIDYYSENLSLFKSSCLKFCIHAPFIDINLASTNEGIRKESVRQIKDAIQFAKNLGVRILTFHPGKYRNSLMVQEAYMLLDLSISELLPFAEQNNVLLCLENMEPGKNELCVSVIQVQKVLERHPKLGFTLDLAHVAMVVESEEELMQYYGSLQDRVSHFHISGIKPRMSHVEVSLKESDVDFTNICICLANFSHF
jgi:sugar phosphate isomerase/epimerase